MNNLMSIGLKSLLTNQRHMETIAHNIANINTPGYSRQRVVQQADLPISDAISSIGTGVYVQRIERVRDQFLETQFRQQQSNSGYWDAFSKRLYQLESMINEPSFYGLGESLNDFWNKWENLSTNPNSNIHRRDLIETTNFLAHSFHEIDAHLKDKRDVLSADLNNIANRINNISEELSHLNRLIQESRASGTPANDLLDRFDLLVDELSQYGNVKVETRENNAMIVYLGTDELVKQDSNRRLMTINHPDSHQDKGILQLVWDDNFKAVNGLNSGEIAGIIDLRDDVLVKYQKNIDELAVELAHQVNKIHRKGFNLMDPPSTFQNFFSEKITGAGDFALSDEILQNPLRISTGLEGIEGDNRIALEITSLRHELFFNESRTFTDFYSDFLNDIGNDSAKALRNKEYFEMAKSQADNFRESVKGVSMDEEAANLLKYQKAFQAASKIIQMSDNLMSTIINLR